MQLNTILKLTQLSQASICSDLSLSPLDAKYEVQLLLGHAFKANLAWLIANQNEVIPTNIYIIFETLLNRRLNGEPIAYILGYREFFGLQLKVSADTLIPRPDTETLVEAALEKILMRPVSRVLDLGTGSGAIALAIAKHRPSAQVTAIDSSQATLAIAIENAQHLNIKNVYFALSNWFSALENEKFDVITSNPPYIEADDVHLTRGDLRFEPHTALASGVDGFDDIRIIVNNSPKYLKPNGWLMLEHGYTQAEHVAELFAQNGFTQISHVQDLAGILRVTIGCYVDD